MALSRMQDIGGLRAVVSTMHQLQTLCDIYLTKKQLTHKRVRQTDYVASPKPSGYRSIHLVYRYDSKTATAYNGLLLELQFRTRLQHAWATAVETMGTLLQHSLKASEGPTAWLDFFAQCSSSFAFIEGSPLVPGYESDTKQRSFSETIARADMLAVPEKLHAYNLAVDAIPARKRGYSAAYYVVILDIENRSVEVEPFNRESLDAANRRYTEIEKRISTTGKSSQVVLVSAGSIESLRRAYPNYFLDTNEFVEHLEQVRGEVYNHGHRW